MMEKWEYTVLTHVFEGSYCNANDIWELKNSAGQSTLDVMNEMGLKGWELVSTDTFYRRYFHGNFETPQLTLFLKRKIG